jgi:hypothetical protein
MRLSHFMRPVRILTRASPVLNDFCALI